MKIFLKNKLLTKSAFFEEPHKERRKRWDHREPLEWVVYTWGSKIKLNALPENVLLEDSKTINTTLNSYHHPTGKINELLNHKINNLSLPNHYLFVSAKKSLIETPYSKMKEIVDILEGNEIDCLLSTGNLFHGKTKYLSFNLEKKIDKSFFKPIKYLFKKEEKKSSEIKFVEL
jgi:hypothetical protein